jgi:hypothetical protein
MGSCLVLIKEGKNRKSRDGSRGNPGLGRSQVLALNGSLTSDQHLSEQIGFPILPDRTKSGGRKLSDYIVTGVNEPSRYQFAVLNRV